jgi:hypothetical protein
MNPIIHQGLGIKRNLSKIVTGGKISLGKGPKDILANNSGFTGLLILLIIAIALRKLLNVLFLPQIRTN